MAGVLDQIYRSSPVEIVFCLGGELDQALSALRVTRAWIAPQSSNTAHMAKFTCEGANGFLHNHPGEGRGACELSSVDIATMRREYDFALGWCSERRFFWMLSPRAARVVSRSSG